MIDERTGMGSDELGPPGIAAGIDMCDPKTIDARMICVVDKHSCSTLRMVVVDSCTARSFPIRPWQLWEGHMEGKAIMTVFVVCDKVLAAPNNRAKV